MTSQFYFLIKDEIRHLIGNETTREGVLRIFELLQNHPLNRRLVYIIFEGILNILFPGNSMQQLFDKLFSESYC